MEAVERVPARHEAGVLAYFMRRTRSPDLAWDLAAETWAAAALLNRGGEPDRDLLFAVARETLCAALRCGQVPDRARRKARAPRVPLSAERSRWVCDVATPDELEGLVAGLQPALREAVMAPVSASAASALAAKIRPAPPRASNERRFVPRLARIGLAAGGRRSA